MFETKQKNTLSRHVCVSVWLSVAFLYLGSSDVTELGFATSFTLSLRVYKGKEKGKRSLSEEGREEDTERGERKVTKTLKKQSEIQILRTTESK